MTIHQLNPQSLISSVKHITEFRCSSHLLPRSTFNECLKYVFKICYIILKFHPAFNGFIPQPGSPITYKKSRIVSKCMLKSKVENS
jgi:hypothetical protein